MPGLEGRHYWLLGCSAGIGRALAAALAGQGVRLTLSARNVAALEELQASLGSGHAVCRFDVNAPLAAQDAPEADAIDGLIYCVGDYEPMTAATFDAARAAELVAANLTGCLAPVGHVLGQWRARGHGHLAFVGSLAGIRALPNSLAYGASKAGLEHLAECLAVDCRAHGIKVQLFRPGFVRTRLTDKNDFAMPFLLEPEDAARRIVRGLAGRRFRIDFPRRLAWPLRLAAALPDVLHHRVMGGRRRN